MIPFGWYGGKYRHLGWLLAVLPPSTHYCEPFGGSAVVLLNREPSPVETYNDLDQLLVVFFRTLREERDALIEAIGLTPFSREEFRRSLVDDPTLDNVERARRFYVRARQVRSGLAQTATNGRWAHCVLTSRAGMSGSVSRWLGAVDDLPAIAQRLLRVQLEHDDALAVIRRYDSAETLFYCDPPYPLESRNGVAYQHEMTTEQHHQLADVLAHAKGKVAISGYHCPLMDHLYRDWNVFEPGSRYAYAGHTLREEVVWTNYALEENQVYETFW